MSSCESCIHNTGNESDFNEYCMQCAEMNPNVDKLQCDQKITCNANVVILCSGYYKNGKYTCSFARFDTDDRSKMFGYGKICSYTDHITDSLYYCECYEAKKYAIEHMMDD